MNDSSHKLDPTLADRLPAEMRQMLEPRGNSVHNAEFDRGLLSGLQVATQLLQAAGGGGEGLNKALEAAASQVSARLAVRDEDTRRMIAAYMRDNEAEMLAFYTNLDKQKWVPAEQLHRELKEIVQRKKKARSEEQL